jgi:hypothetical protein
MGEPIITAPNEVLSSTVRNINIDNLPKVEGVLIKGKPINQLSRPELIEAVHVLIGRLMQVEMGVSR